MSKTQSSSENKWKARVDSDLQAMSRHILRYFPEARKYNCVEKAAALHLYVYEKVDFQSRDFDNNPRDIRRPKECWKSSGNCQEQTILLASLLKSVPELETSTKALSHNQERSVGHRTLEVRIPYTGKYVNQKLERFYDRTNHFDGKLSRVHWTLLEKSNEILMVADPTMSRYLGDLSSQRNKGYVVNRGGSWQWYQVDSKNAL
jgi:hypothetical protein